MFYTDPLGVLVVSQNIIKNHSLELSKVAHYWHDVLPSYPNYQIYTAGNHVYYSYPYGTPIISIPVVYIANLMGLNMLHSEHIVQVVECSLIAFGIFMTIYTLSIYYFGFIQSILIGLAGLYRTTVGTVVDTGLYNMNLEILFSGLAILISYRYVKTGNTLRICEVEISSFLTALLLFLAFISRPTASPLILFIFLFFLGYDKRYFIKLAVTSAILLTIYEIIMCASLGSLLVYGADWGCFSTKNFITALRGFIWSPGRSVPIFDPFLLLLPAVLFLMLKLKDGSIPHS